MLKIGCQTYTWEMLGERWTGDAPTTCWRNRRWRLCRDRDHRHDDRHYAGRPRSIRRGAGASMALTLVAFACGSASGFTEPRRVGRRISPRSTGRSSSWPAFPAPSCRSVAPRSMAAASSTRSSRPRPSSTTGRRARGAGRRARGAASELASQHASRSRAPTMTGSWR